MTDDLKDLLNFALQYKLQMRGQYAGERFERVEIYILLDIGRDYHRENLQPLSYYIDKTHRLLGD